LYSFIEISILIHATENENKVLKAIFEFMEQSIELVKVEYAKTEGHWKNPILLFKLFVDLDVDKIFNKLHSHLVESHGESDINNYIENNIDKKGHFYARLDKQKFCSGKIILSDKDSIRMVFKKLGKFKK
jgi:RNA binding exosome subunit